MPRNTLLMPSKGNTAVIACAGSGKTTRLVDDALRHPQRRIAIVTYTNFNAEQILRKFGQRNSGLPSHVDVMTWFGFLLRHCARPYQRALYPDKRIESLQFVNRLSAKFVKESNTRRHYFAGDRFIYSDKISKFVVKCNQLTSDMVAKRLGEIYSQIFIDEFQDLAGWDIDVVEMLLKSEVEVTLVGDPRQHIYSTNQASKNQKFRGVNVVGLVEKWRDEGLCSLEEMHESYRCSGGICDFANRLWPGMTPMSSLQTSATDHGGVFLVAEALVGEYASRYSPQVLRYDKSVDTFGLDALNFGLAKGLEFERVLIVPTNNFAKYLKTGSLKAIEKTRDKLHVAVTRAAHSVAFVFDGPSAVVEMRWEP